MLVRRATIADADSIAHVQVDTWRASYRGIVPASYLDGLSYERSSGMWAKAIRGRDKGSGVLVAQEEGGAIVGFASFGPERSGDRTYRGELYAVYVLQGSQKRGIGSTLVVFASRELLEKGFTSMLLWVLVDNPSRRFYEKLGGQYLRDQSIEIGGVKLQEVAYGWRDLSSLEGLLQARLRSQS